MRTSIRWLCASALLTLSPMVLAAADPGACLGKADASLTSMTQGDFAKARRDFAPAVAKALPAAKLGQVWSTVQETFGAYRSRGAANVQTFEGQPAVVAPLKFAQGPLDFIARCDASGRIDMFRMLPPSVAADRSPVTTRTVSNGVREQPLPVPSRYGPLRGALTLPTGKGPFPAVVLVGGSGPNDLDETVGGSKPFLDIARGLAAAGITSLRYDKRQTDYPLKMSANPELTVDDEATDDALTAAKLLAKQPQVDAHRIFVLGHSQGAMLAPRIGQRDTHLAGLILMAAPARQFLAVMREQTREQDKRLGAPKAKIDAAEKALAAEQTLLDQADPKRPPAGAFSGAPQSWWLSLHAYDQVAIAKSLSIPMLILQGESDFQVSPEKDFAVWKSALAGKPRVTFHLYPGLSHLFTRAGKTLTTVDYAKPVHVDAAVIGDIAAWIKAQPPARLSRR